MIRKLVYENEKILIPNLVHVLTQDNNEEHRQAGTQTRRQADKTDGQNILQAAG